MRVSYNGINVIIPYSGFLQIQHTIPQTLVILLRYHYNIIII